nr:hypothetical protein [Tanacetum cinerariifolium]
MGDKHLDTIPKTESDELIKSSVENLVPSPSESKDLSDADCDPEVETHLIEKLLYDKSSLRPLEEFIFENSDDAIESFSPSPIPVEDSDSLRDEIDLSLTSDDSMPPGIKDDDHDSEGDILIFEELLNNDFLLLLENESFHFDIPSSLRPLAKPSDDDEIEPNSRILNVKKTHAEGFCPPSLHFLSFIRESCNETTAAEIPSDRGKAPRIAAFTKDVVEAVVTMIPSVDNTNYRLSPIFISRELWVVVVVSIAYNLCGFDFFDRIKLVVPTPSASGGLITDVETLSEDNSALVDLVDEGV